jgi:hypothetical protein
MVCKRSHSYFTPASPISARPMCIVAVGLRSSGRPSIRAPRGTSRILSILGAFVSFITASIARVILKVKLANCVPCSLAPLPLSAVRPCCFISRMPRPKGQVADIERTFCCGRSALTEIIFLEVTPTCYDFCKLVQMVCLISSIIPSSSSLISRLRSIISPPAEVRAWLFPSADPLYSSFLATMLATQASGTTITVTTSGCVGISGSQQPRISDIQPAACFRSRWLPNSIERDESAGKPIGNTEIHWFRLSRSSHDQRKRVLAFSCCCIDPIVPTAAERARIELVEVAKINEITVGRVLKLADVRYVNPHGGVSAFRKSLYDGAGYLNEVQDAGAGTPFWTLTSANDNGAPTMEVLGNAVSVATGYTPWTNQMVTRTEGSAGSTTNLQNLSYTWDPNGNVLSRVDNRQNLIEVFTLDALNRLSTVTLNGVQTLSVQYDQAGDIINKSDIGAYTYGNAAHPHAVTAAGTWTIGYDLNGNMNSRAGGAISSYSYNLPNQIKCIGSSSKFNYDSSHQRWKQVANYAGATETIHYIGGLLEVMTRGSSPTEYRHQIPADSSTAVYTRRADGTTGTYYATSDHGRVGQCIDKRELHALWCTPRQ